MVTTNKFFNLSNLPKCEASPAGEEIYEWEYLDKIGALKKDKKNVYESIQSFKNQVDYKKRLEQGETFNNGSGIYMDTTKFSGDYGDLNEYIARLASDIRSYIEHENDGAVENQSTNSASQKIKEAVRQSGENSSESGTADNGTAGGNGK